MEISLFVTLFKVVNLKVAGTTQQSEGGKDRTGAQARERSRSV